jgi:DNA processing protein
VTAAVDEELACMRLAELPVAASAWWRRVLRETGSAAPLFAMSEADLAGLGFAPKGIAALREESRWSALEKLRVRCRRLAIEIVPFTAGAYPALLREIPDPPPVLYSRGCAPAALEPAVAVVGSRTPTRYGRRVAHLLASRLAGAGVVVVSGMAYGIDSAAHRGALGAGRSAAVLAGGLDRPYPRANRELFEALAASGCVVSEQPPGTDARPYLFPARNRIVTGMSRAVVVVEAAERSGSLVSARLGVEQGREVFAVPGEIDSPTSAGTNALLRDGCAPCLGVADVLDALGIATPSDPGGPAPPAVQDPDAARVLAQLDARPTALDRLVESCGLDGARVSELLTALELAGLAERSAGGFSRVASLVGSDGGGRGRAGALDHAPENRHVP